MTQKQKALSAEEELLLQDFSRNVSTKSNALFYGNAFIVSAIPICKKPFSCLSKKTISVSHAHLIQALKISSKHYFFFIRAFLENSLYGFAYIVTSFCHHDPCEHLPCFVCLQEHQVHLEA